MVNSTTIKTDNRQNMTCPNLIFKLIPRCLPNNHNMSIICEDKGRQVSINFKNQVFPRRNNPDDEHILIPDSVQVQSPEKLTTIGWSFYVRLKSRQNSYTYFFFFCGGGGRRAVGKDVKVGAA